MSRRGLLGAVSVVVLLNIVSRVFGFFRETSLAMVFGATASTDAYLVALTIPYFLFAIVSHGLTTTFIPVYSHIREEKGQPAAFRFSRTLIWVVTLVGLVIIVLGFVLTEGLVRLVAPGFSGPVAQLTAHLTRIMFPMMIFQLFSGIATGMLQAHDEFVVPASVILLQNTVVIGSILLLGRLYGISFVAIGTLVGTGLAALAMLPALHRIGFRWRVGLDLNEPGLRQMLRLMLPGIVGSGTGQLNTLVDRVLASGLPSGSIAALTYADRLMYLAPSIIGSPMSSVMYPNLAKLAARRDWEGFSHRLAQVLALIHFLLAPIAMGVLVLRVPLVRIVYERGVFDALATKETAWALLFFCLGIAVFPMRDLVNQAFFAMQNTTTPMKLGLAGVGINITLNLLLVGPLAQGGLALATTLAGLAGLVFGVHRLGRQLPGGFPAKLLLSSIGRALLASGAMGVVVWLAMPAVVARIGLGGVWGDIVNVLLLAGIGAVSYGFLVWLLRVPELPVVLLGLRRILGKNRTEGDSEPGS